MVVADRVVVELEARTDRYQQNLRRAEQTSTRATGNISTGFRNAASSIAVMDGPLGGVASRFSALGTVFHRNNLIMGASVLAVGGLTYAFGRMLRVATEAIDEFDRLGKTARTIGLSTDLYQSLGFAALEEGVDGLDSSLEQFMVRSGQIAQAQGELYTYLKNTNVALLEQVAAATDQE